MLPETGGGACSYLVCTTARAGASLLCRLLAGTGLAGRPEQAFSRSDRRPWADDDLRARLERVRSGASANGVYGAWITWPDLEPLAAALRAGRTELDGVSSAEVLDDVFPGLRLLFFRRRDTIRQAAQWWWWAEGSRTLAGAPRYDRYRIEERRSWIEAQNEAWRAWFTGSGRVPHDVLYEDVLERPAAAVGAALGHLGVEIGDRALPAAPVEPVDEPGTERWVHRHAHPRRAGTLRRSLVRARRVRASRSVLVCGLPRSGTSLLAGLLVSTGLFRPIREYFRWSNEPAWAEGSYGLYVRSTIAGNTGKGVFGSKLVDEQLWRLLLLLRLEHGDECLSDRELLERAFPGLRVIWLSRLDVVAQAVSLSKARQTGVWSRGLWAAPGGDGPAAAPTFAFDEVRRCFDHLRREQERWERWFRDNELEPLRLTYEELNADNEGVTRRALAFLSVEAPPDLPIRALTYRQADAVNEDWIARYRGAAAGPPA